MGLAGFLIGNDTIKQEQLKCPHRPLTRRKQSNDTH
nr:MAG TPA: hypothetical protein [Caudoviricetes sp.]